MPHAAQVPAWDPMNCPWMLYNKYSFIAEAEMKSYHLQSGELLLKLILLLLLLLLLLHGLTQRRRQLQLSAVGLGDRTLRGAYCFWFLQLQHRGETNLKQPQHQGEVA